jgi:hypothetical protein
MYTKVPEHVTGSVVILRNLKLVWFSFDNLLFRGQL